MLLRARAIETQTYVLAAAQVRQSSALCTSSYKGVRRTILEELAVIREIQRGTVAVAAGWTPQ